MKMFRKISIVLAMVWVLAGSTSFADYLTADPQSDDVKKYRIELNGEILQADIDYVSPDLVQLRYDLDHLGDGRHLVAASAGNHEGEWSAWSDTLEFYRGVPTPQNIHLFCGTEVLPVQDPIKLSQDNWKVVYASSEDSGKGKFARLAIDGRPDTYWRTDIDYPHEIQIDLGEVYHISGFYYLARQDEKWNGTIQEYAFYGSLDGQSWTELCFGELEKTREEQLEEFLSQEVRYVSLQALSEVDGGLRTVISELNILGY